MLLALNYNQKVINIQWTLFLCNSEFGGNVRFRTWEILYRATYVTNYKYIAFGFIFNAIICWSLSSSSSSYHEPCNVLHISYTFAMLLLPFFVVYFIRICLAVIHVPWNLWRINCRRAGKVIYLFTFIYLLLKWSGLG